MKAVILCAGKGSRLREETKHVPKPMLDLKGRPILYYILMNLKRQGFDQVAINLHYLPETISDYFGDGKSMGIHISYSIEPALLGTAGALTMLRDFLGDGPVLVHYGDILTSQDFRPMIQMHRVRSALATLLLHRRASSNSIVEMDSDMRITRFIERPSKHEPRDNEADWVNSGVAVINPTLIDRLPVGQFADLPSQVFAGLVSQGAMYGYPLNSFRCAIDSPERLTRARNALLHQDFKLPNTH